MIITNLIHFIIKCVIYYYFYRYVAERLELSVFDPMYRAFANVFENFRISDFRKPDDLKTEDPNINLKKVPKLDIEEDDTDVREIVVDNFCMFN